MRISNPKDMGGNKLLHRVNVATGGVIQGEGTETSPLTANVEAIASNVFPAFSGNSGKVLRVNANETGTEWAEMASTGLSDDSKIVRYVNSYDDYLEVCDIAREQDIHHSTLFLAASDISGDFLEVRKSMDGEVVDDMLRKGHAYLRVDTSGLPSSSLQERTVSTSTYVVEKVRFVSRTAGDAQTINLISGREDAHYIFPDSFEKASSGQYGITFQDREPAPNASLNGGWPTAGVDISKRISAYKEELEKEGTYIGPTPWYLADSGVANVKTAFKKKAEGYWLTGYVSYDPSTGKTSESFTASDPYDLVFLYKDSTGSYVETPTPNATVTTIENNGQYGGVAVEATIDITPDQHRLTIKALEGPYLEVSPGNAYSATLSANSTLSATGGEDGYHQEAYLDVNPGTYSLTPGNGITFVHDITASKVNYCRIVWTGTSARLLVDDVSGSSGESSSSSSSESSSSSGTDEGTITTSSQTIAGTAGTSLSYNLADYVTVSNGQTPTFTLVSGQVLPAGLSLSGSGVISGTPEASSSATIRVKVSANNCPDVEMTVTFNIAESTPQGTITITNNPTISGVVGTAISPYNLSSCVTVSNGKTPSFSWYDTYAPRPLWLTLTGAGILSGTPSSVPTEPGGRVTVSADNCNSAYIDITWDIINAGTITIDNQTIDGTVGNAVSLNLGSSTTVSNGQTPTFTVKSGNTLPAGIELSSAGVLSGTPTATSSATVVVTITARGCPDKEVSITFNITEAGGETPSDGWPTKIVVSNASSEEGSDVSAYNGEYTRTGGTLSILGEDVPIWSNGSKYIYGMSSSMGSDLNEPAIALQDATGENDAFMSYYYRMKSESSWQRADAANAIRMTATITEDYTSGGESGGTKEYVYTLTGATDDYAAAAANGDYYATGEIKNNYPVYTNGTYFMFYIPTEWQGWTVDKSTSGGGSIYKMQSTDPIGYWYPEGVVVSAYSGSSSGGESSSSSSGSEEPAPSDEWPTTITVSDATATSAGSSWTDEWNGTYTRTGDTTTALGETIPVWSNGKNYVMGYGTERVSALSEVGIGFFIDKNHPDRWSSYYYRAKSATTWTRGPAATNGPNLTMTITEDYTSGGESSSSSSSGEAGGGVTYTMSRTSGSDSHMANALGTYSLKSGTDGNTDAVYVNKNGWRIYYNTATSRWALGESVGNEQFICSTLEGTYTAWDYECNDVLVLKKDGETGGGDSFPTTFTVTACDGNGAAVGTYAKTANTTTVGGKDYPVYSMTQELLGTTFYIYVCGHQMGSAGTFWALKAGSYSASDDSYGALGSCAARAMTDGLPQSTSWSSASSSATVSWT